MSLESEITNQVIYVLCTLGILTLGIAHGAIDNVLYGAKPGKSNANFILKYIFIIILFAVFWILLPNLAFLGFLLISAYHFGQSQFTDYDLKPKWVEKLLFISWGSSILLLLFYFNAEEFRLSHDSYFHFSGTLNHIIDNASIYLSITASFFAASFIRLITVNRLKLDDIIKEVYILSFIACSIYLLPPFVAFSLFFVFVHSFKVILQEFDYCKKSLSIPSVSRFIKLFLPLTISSLLGTGAIIVLVVYVGKTDFLPYVLLILLSCITTPHAFVMEIFYQKRSITS